MARTNGTFNRSNSGPWHVGQTVRDSGGARVTIACIAHGVVYAYTPRGLAPIRPAAEDECEQGPGAIAPGTGRPLAFSAGHLPKGASCSCNVMAFAPRSPCRTHIHAPALDSRPAA